MCLIVEEDIMELEKKKEESETSSPAIFIITPYDGELASVWTRRAPSANVLLRAQSLAKSAIGYLEHSLLKETKDNVLVSVFILETTLTFYL